MDAADVWPDRRHARRRFDRAAAGFAAAAFIHDEARERLLERLEFLATDPRTIVDLGCGTGAGAAALAKRYPQARLIAIDSSPAMLAEARRNVADLDCVVGDAEQLPCRDGSVDLLFANLALPWCRPDRFAAEAARVLSPDGVLLMSTVGPETLAAVRLAWRGIDRAVHVHGFLDMHDLGDLLGRAGLAEPVMDIDRLTVTYPDPAALIGDLTRSGARNAAPARPAGLTSRGRWARFEGALDAARVDGRIAVGVELIFAQAWGRGRAAARPQPAGNAEISVPIDRIGRR